MNLILRIILQGVYDEDCVLSYLKGTPHIVKEIWSHVNYFYKSHITLPMNYGNFQSHFFKKFDYYQINNLHHTIFPKPTGINISMMPYIYGGHNFRNYKLPENLKPYFPLIRFCKTSSISYDYNADKGKVFYLTIKEGWVECNKSHLVPGIYTDNQGHIPVKDSSLTPLLESKKESLLECHWGSGRYLRSGRHEGGIFIASNSSNSVCAWDCKIERNPETGRDIIGPKGSCEHCKWFLPKERRTMMSPNSIYWITDRTPYESLRLSERTYCQFFKVVTEYVSVWFADESTENPYGVLPDSNITKIVKGSKSDTNSFEIIDHERYMINKMKSFQTEFKLKT